MTKKSTESLLNEIAFRLLLPFYFVYFWTRYVIWPYFQPERGIKDFYTKGRLRRYRFQLVMAVIWCILILRATNDATGTWQVVAYVLLFAFILGGLYDGIPHWLELRRIQMHTELWSIREWEKEAIEDAADDLVDRVFKKNIGKDQARNLLKKVAIALADGFTLDDIRKQLGRDLGRFYGNFRYISRYEDHVKGYVADHRYQETLPNDEGNLELAYKVVDDSHPDGLRPEVVRLPIWKLR